jgi:hypothetical protein
VRRFEPSVDVLLRVFSVLIGTSFTLFLKDSPLPGNSELMRCALTAALFSLSLRYFMGTGNHLTVTYKEIESSKKDPPIPIFLKDVTFLLMFGYFVVRISQSCSIHEFMCRAEWLLLISFCWSCLDPFFHKIVTRKLPLRKFWLHWLVLNFTQLVFTLVIDHWPCPHTDVTASVWLGAGYVLFFGWDFCQIIKISSIKAPCSRENAGLSGPSVAS